MDRQNAVRSSWRTLLIVVVVATTMGVGGEVAAGQATCSTPSWTSTASYAQGTVVAHRGHQWRATHRLWPGVEPGVAGSPPWWVPWVDLGPCGPGPTTSTTSSTTTTTTPPSGGVEERYDAAGPWAVTSGTATAPGIPGVTLHYPTLLGRDGHQHPIITFGNGTGNSCSVYEQGLRHYASWGFAVVCANSSWTGSGQEIWAAAQWLRDQDSVPGSVFFGKLDTAKVGASGGSQGASGAVNAEILSGGAIDSTVAVALVDPWLHVWGPPPDFSRVRAPTFLLSGTADGLTSQAQQTTYYNAIAGPGVKAASVGSDHDTIGQARRGLGYTTAWFKYTLESDPLARRAFVGSAPELLADSSQTWANQAIKGLA